MLANLLGLLILILLTILFVWIVVRSRQIHSAWVKWPVLILSGLFTLVFGLLTIFAVKGLSGFYVTRDLPLPPISIEGTTEQIAHGEHIARFTCVSCHSTNDQLPLSGGIDISRKSPVPIGSLIPFNLTPGGPLKEWSDAEIFRAIRSGVDRDGHPLIAMSNLSFRYLSDEDIHAVIAYLRSQPAIKNPVIGGDHPNLLFALFTGSGLVPNPAPVTGVVIAPVKGPTAAYGQYIVHYLGCSDCHGTDLNGGKSGGLTPVGPSLRAAGAWSQEQFILTIRTGTTPGGHALDPEKMFWKLFANMDDEELSAIHAYLHSLQDVQTQGQP